jgi:hypothetical protein
LERFSGDFGLARVDRAEQQCLLDDLPLGCRSTYPGQPRKHIVEDACSRSPTVLDRGLETVAHSSDSGRERGLTLSSTVPRVVQDMDAVVVAETVQVPLDDVPSMPRRWAW